MDCGRHEHYPFTVYTYDVVDSTNSVARRAISMEGERMDMSVHITGEQTAGRGRKDRKWLNTDEAVMMSIVQKTKLSLVKMPLINLAAAYAVRNALIKLSEGAADFSVKWPNDVVVSETSEKICGILSEAVDFDGSRYAIVGIGVNLNAGSMPDGLLQPATSLYMECGKHTPLMTAAHLIIDEYEKAYRYMTGDTEAFLKDFSKVCISIGRHVKVDDGSSVRYGVGYKLASSGQLTVDFEDGATEVIYAADVSVRGLDTITDRLAKSIRVKRRRDSNKGDNGKAAMIVGSEPMPGAALMSTKACIRAGAGLTKVLIPEALTSYFSAVPEAMLVTDDDRADELIEWADAIGCGCGLGVNGRTRALVEKILRSGKKCVLDADALNTLSAYPELMELLHENVVITPHPGEMGRLIGRDSDCVIKNFTATALEFAKSHNCIVLLKSAASVIASPDGEARYNERGNAGLAKGGSGDVLCGIVASMLAQGAKPFDAASLGAYLLGVSAEKALDFLRTRFVCATDVIDVISSESK
jgi:biotin-[acetyl-CoA-carboxylase] ligase BirA-like protein